MRTLLRSLAPTTFEDVAALVALYRPGPMAQNWHNEYADRKNGRKPVTYPHPDLEEVLAPTYGLMIYQEQLMRVAQRLAGYSLEEADNLRKATGKKIRELIAKERTKFVDGCVAQGHTAQFGEQHVRHHRAVRRLLVQQVALGRLRLRRVPDRVPEGEPPGRVPRRAAHERQDQQGPDRGLPQRVPAAGHRRCSSPTSTSRTPTSRCAPMPTAASAIRFGLSAVRNVGEGVVAHIVAARERRRAVHRLLRLLRPRRPVGAEQAHDRVAGQGGRVRLARPSRARAWCSCTRRSSRPCSAVAATRPRASSTCSPRSASPTPEAVVGHRIAIPDTEFPKAQRLAFEKEMLGLYVSDHPMMGAERALRTLRRLHALRAARGA